MTREIAKAHWNSEGESISLNVEFSKVNKEKRIVSGWATIDSIDTENDQVTADAAMDAFSRARGNLREMHKKDSAVGRIVSFKQADFRAPDGKVYKGIFVNARISEGAENTWKKVLDGTLSAFSIGGQIVEREEVFNKDAGANVRRVTKFDLTELSLVDNPGNQYCNIMSIQKSADGSVKSISGMVEEQRILNVHYCADDQLTVENPADFHTCPVCDETMEVIGFIEDGGNRDNKVSELVTKYLGPREGGEDMGILRKSVINEDEPESVATGHEEGDPQEVPTPANTDVVEEPAEEVDEVHDEESDLKKHIDSMRESLESILKDNTKATTEKIDALEKAVADTRDFMETKISEFNHKFDKLDTDLEANKSRLSSFEKSLDSMNKSSALKKSADLDDSAEPLHEDIWTDSAFSVQGLRNGL